MQAVENVLLSLLLLKKERKKEETVCILFGPLRLIMASLRIYTFYGTAT